MASTIVTKNSSTASAVPVTGDLTQGELAVNVTDKKLYTKDSGGTVVKLVGGLGNQEANAVAITGGSINGTTVGATTASTGAFTTLSASSTTTLSGGTANGVAYLNGSKVLTTGSALTFDGTNLTTNAIKAGSNAGDVLFGRYDATYPTSGVGFFKLGTNNYDGDTGGFTLSTLDNGTLRTSYQVIETSGSASYHVWNASGSEQMRLTSTGLGIGTSSPSYKLDVAGPVQSSAGYYINGNTSGGYVWVRDNYALRFGTNDTERMRLDSSGNLGLGVTPSAWSGNFRAIDVGTTAAFYAAPANAVFSAIDGNTYSTGAGAFYKTTGLATRYFQLTTGVHAWYNAPSGTAGNAITFTQAMTLDASGNLGIGTTSPSNRLSVAGSTGTIASFTNGATADFSIICGSSITSLNAGGANILAFQTGGTERARIDSSGNLLVGTTSAIGKFDVSGNGPSNYAATITSTLSTGNVLGVFGNTNGATQNFVVFAQAGIVKGSITTNGSTTAYNTSSDYRLKEDIQPMTGALAKVAALKPCTYKWKSDGSNGEGFIAHELQAVVPQCVTGEKDAVDAEGNPQYQGIDTSFLVATLTAALQEMKAIIDEQAARIAALEAK